MKKNLLIAIAVTGLLSCGGGPSKEEIKKGADKICNCITEKTAERGETNDNLSEAMMDMDYALCGLDVAMDGIDASTAEFSAAVAESCPEYKEAHARYVESLNEEK